MRPLRPRNQFVSPFAVLAGVGASRPLSPVRARVGQAASPESLSAVEVRAGNLQRKFALLAQDFSAAFKAPPMPASVGDYTKDWDAYQKWEANLPAALRGFRAAYQDWKNWYGTRFAQDGTLLGKTTIQDDATAVVNTVQTINTDLAKFENEYENQKRSFETSSGKKARSIDEKVEGAGDYLSTTVKIAGYLALGYFFFAFILPKLIGGATQTRAAISSYKAAKHGTSAGGYGAPGWE